MSKKFCMIMKDQMVEERGLCHRHRHQHLQIRCNGTTQQGLQQQLLYHFTTSITRLFHFMGTYTYYTLFFNFHHDFFFWVYLIYNYNYWTAPNVVNIYIFFLFRYSPTYIATDMGYNHVSPRTHPSLIFCLCFLLMRSMFMFVSKNITLSISINGLTKQNTRYLTRKH